MLDATGNLKTKIRSPNNFQCMLAGAPAAITAAPSTDPLVECSDSNRFLSNYYNPDSTLHVGINTFQTTLTDKMKKCCGVYCPPSAFASWRGSKNCDAVVQTVFPEQTGPDSSGRFGRLEGMEFLNNLRASNDSTLFPLCKPSGEISIVQGTSTGRRSRRDGDLGGSGSGSGENDPDASASKFVPVTGQHTSTLTLNADQGEARVVTAANISLGLGSTSPTTYKPAGASPGLRLTEDSAQQLAVIRDKYGDRAAFDDAYITIYVTETDEHPGGVFLYSSNPVFLALSPAFLGVVGGFALLPHREQVLVHLVSDDCDADTYSPAGTKWTADTPRYQEQMAQVHAVLTRSLRPPAQLSLKGKLVRVPTERENHALCKDRYDQYGNGTMAAYVTANSTSPVKHSKKKSKNKTSKNKAKSCKWALFHPQYQVLNPDVDVALDGTIEYTGDEELEAEAFYEGMHMQAMQVVLFSVLVAGILGTVGMVLIMKDAKKKLIKKYNEQALSFKLGMKGATEPLGDVAVSPTFMPLEVPVDLFKLLLPYRSLFIDSLKRFFYRYYRPVVPHDYSESRWCWSIRGYSNNTAEKDGDTMSTDKRISRASSVRREREESVHAGHSTELKHYELEGAGMKNFKDLYAQFCLEHELQAETDAMAIRSFIMLEATDPGATDTHKAIGFQINVVKSRTLTGIMLKKNTFDHITSLVKEANLKHVLAKALNTNPNSRKRTESFLEVLGCCSQLTDGKVSYRYRHLYLCRSLLGRTLPSCSPPSAHSILKHRTFAATLSPACRAPRTGVARLDDPI